MLRRVVSQPLSPYQHRLAQLLSAREPRTLDVPSAILASVAVIIAPDPDSILLIRRSERVDDPWSGHMAFPGGRWCPGDVDVVDTARRETAEEVGLVLDRGALLGELDDVAPRTPTATPLVVRPFVFAVSDRVPLRLNHEVALAMWAELEELRAPEIRRPHTMMLRGELRTFPAYHIAGQVIWGMTERVVSQLLEEGQSGPSAISLRET